MVTFAKAHPFDDFHRSSINIYHTHVASMHGQTSQVNQAPFSQEDYAIIEEVSDIGSVIRGTGDSATNIHGSQ